MPARSPRASIRPALSAAPSGSRGRWWCLITIEQKLPKPAAKLRTFDKQTLSERFVSEGCALADFDHDGHVDLTAGNSI